MMTNFFLLYTLLLVAFPKVHEAAHHHHNISFPDALYPTEISRSSFKKMCPLQSYKLDYCIPKYEDCFGQMNSIEDCKLEFLSCNQINDSDSHDSCSNYSINAQLSVIKNGSGFRKSIIGNRTKPVVDRILKRVEPISEAFSLVLKECQIEDLSRLKKPGSTENLTMSPSDELFERVLPFFLYFKLTAPKEKSTRCLAAFKSIEKVMEQEDAKTSRNLRIPYNFWHLGTQFGALGKVILRVISDETCGKASLDLNHHSAVHLNCYDQQLPQEQCDEAYFDSLKSTLSTLDSKKLNCKMLIDLIEVLHPMKSEQFYREAATYYSKSTTITLNGRFDRGFSELLNGSLTERDTKNIIVKMEGTEKLRLRTALYFDTISSECGHSRGIVSSCGFKFAYCTEFIRSRCEIQLLTCLENIDEAGDTCKHSIKLMSDVLWPGEVGRLTVVESTSTPAFDLHVKKGGVKKPMISTAVVVLLVSIIAGIILMKLLLSYKKRQQPEKHKEQDDNNSNHQIPEKEPLKNTNNESENEPHMKDDCDVEANQRVGVIPPEIPNNQ